MSVEIKDPTQTPSEAKIEQIIADIVEMVECESSSHDRKGLDTCLALLTHLAARRLGEPGETHRYPGGEFGDIVTLTYPGIGTGHVTIIGHYDTVWPRGTLASWGERSYQDEDGRLRLNGPGIFDMKTGLMQGIWALDLARESGLPTPTVTFLFNGDEEIGSPASRPVIERVTGASDASLVLEPSFDGAVKTERKGVGLFKDTISGAPAPFWRAREG